MVQLVRRVAVAVKPDIAGFRSFGINQLALVSFDVRQVFARAEAEFVGVSALNIVVTSLEKAGSSETCTTTSR